MHTRNQTVETKDVSEVNVDIAFGAGKLKITGGAEELLDAQYKNSSAIPNPQVAYRYNKTEGHLTIKQENVVNIPFGKSEWDLKLNNNIPIDLNLKCGAGDVLLRMSELNLSSLNLKYGAGEMKVDLRGNWDHDIEIWITGGVGSSKIKLPKNMKIVADVTTGLGSTIVNGLTREHGKYVSKNDTNMSNSLTLHVKGGIGEVKLIRED